MYAHNFISCECCECACVLICEWSLGSCVKLLEELTLNFSYYSITKVAAGGPRVEGSSWREHLEGLRRELQGLQSQVQEQVQAQIQTGP